MQMDIVSKSVNLPVKNQALKSNLVQELNTDLIPISDTNL